MKSFVNEPIKEFLNGLLNLSDENSRIFCSQQLERRIYRAEHSTEIAAFKCMDGRIHLPLITETPMGIIQPFRNLAGRFDLGWPYLGELFGKWVDYAISKRRKCLVLVTYHFSKGDNHRGCAGFNYCKEDSLEFTLNFRKQIELVTDYQRDVVYAIILGLETDSDSLIFHGKNHDQILDMNQARDLDSEDMKDRLKELYPDMPKDMISDLLPLVVGNQNHINHPEILNREILDSQHRERVICIGRGFDWLHEPNLALIIGPYSPNLSEPILTALSIVKSSMEKGAILDDGIVVMTGAPYRGDDRLEYKLAIEKSKSLIAFAKKTIEGSGYDSSFVEKIIYSAHVVDVNTRKLKLAN